MRVVDVVDMAFSDVLIGLDATDQSNVKFCP